MSAVLLTAARERTSRDFCVVPDGKPPALGKLSGIGLLHLRENPLDRSDSPSAVPCISYPKDGLGFFVAHRPPEGSWPLRLPGCFDRRHFPRFPFQYYSRERPKDEHWTRRGVRCAELAPAGLWRELVALCWLTVGRSKADRACPRSLGGGLLVEPICQNRSIGGAE